MGAGGNPKSARGRAPKPGVAAKRAGHPDCPRTWQPGCVGPWAQPPGDNSRQSGYQAQL